MNSRGMLRSEISLEAASSVIRAHVCELYHCSNADRIFLCPGQLVGLIHVMHAMQLRSILLTDEEYYTADHFPGMEVSICKPEDVADASLRKHPDVILMSLVSWKGRLLPAQREFRRIRGLSGTRPLLVCDYAHAGAVGFPVFGGQEADIICGDLHKWVLPSTHMAQIAFLWAATRGLRRTLRRAFLGYYLAGEVRAGRAARWISPLDLMAAAQWLRTSNLNRRTLRREYRQNLARAAEIATLLGLDSPPKTCILWLPGAAIKGLSYNIEDLAAQEDVEIWRTSGGWRIVSSSIRCREPL